MLHRLPDNVSLELGALVEPMSVAYHAATLGESTAGDTAMVFGAGPIGIGLWFALRGKGLDDVFVVEPSPTRRAAIEALGARDAGSDSHRRARVHRRPHRGRRRRRGLRRGRGARRRSRPHWPAWDPRKPMISVAIYEKPLETPLLNLVMNESRIQGSLCYTGADFEAVIALDGRRHLRHHRLGDPDRARRRRSTRDSRRCTRARR